MTIWWIPQLWHLCGSDKADLYDYLLMSQKKLNTLNIAVAGFIKRLQNGN